MTKRRIPTFTEAANAALRWSRSRDYATTVAPDEIVHFLLAPHSDLRVPTLGGNLFETNTHGHHGHLSPSQLSSADLSALLHGLVEMGMDFTDAQRIFLEYDGDLDEDREASSYRSFRDLLSSALQLGAIRVLLCPRCRQQIDPAIER